MAMRSVFTGPWEMKSIQTNFIFIMKKFVFICIALIYLANSSFSQQNEVKFLLDSAIHLMQLQAVNTEKVNWPAVKRVAYSMAKDIHDPAKLGPVMRFLYRSIDDYHGAFFYKDSTFRWTKYQLNYSDSITNEWKKGVTPMIRVFDNGIGYLRVPSMPIFEEKEFNTKAQRLNDSLCSLLSRNLHGIILDLRLNGGGAMQPMLLGVHNLLAPGLLGSFDRGSKENWELTDSTFMMNKMVISKISPSCAVDGRNIPVVLLIGAGTGSSGEFFIIPFKHRAKTTLIGSTTSGYVTAVDGFGLNEHAGMNLSLSYGMDIKGNVYRTAFQPDIPIDAPDKFNDLQSDAKVQAAIRWLKERSAF